ncbi:MAG: DUF2393 family protein [Terriglobales bacterium]
MPRASDNPSRMGTGGVFSQPHVEEEGRRWLPLAIGAVIIVVAVAAILIFGRPAKQPAALAIDPYAEYLRISDLKLSAATNFVGVSVSYLDGNITNVGNKTVTGVTVETIFRNSLGQIVQRETLPLVLYHTGLAGFPDVAPLAAAPLTPNQTRDFRLTFEHISADWDQGYPELRFVRIQTQ